MFVLWAAAGTDPDTAAPANRSGWYSVIRSGIDLHSYNQQKLL